MVPCRPCRARCAQAIRQGAARDDGRYPNELSGKLNREPRMAKKILIVDDDPTIVAFLEDLLRDHDYSTCAAHSCAEGLEKARQEKPDLVLLDMEMPDKGGTMFYANMRKETEIRDTPVVVVSGVGPRPPALRKGVPTISKPVDVSLLLTTVAERIA